MLRLQKITMRNLVYSPNNYNISYFRFNGKSAILVEGARRVGKSTIVEEFARNEYDDYILLDFATAL